MPFAFRSCSLFVLCWLLAGWMAAGIAFPGGLQAAEESTAAQAEATFSAADIEFFERQVRPLLVARCHDCHSAKAKELKGGLRLDSRAAVLAGGDSGPAAIPGKPAESRMIQAVHYGDVYQMPPDSKLPKEQIAALEQWVSLGLPWPREAEVKPRMRDSFDVAARRAEHWCWQPRKPHEPPSVQLKTWPRSPLDQFILARLEQAGLTPAPLADKATLIRRAAFDLTGLPPRPEMVQAFLADDSPEAFARVIDSLLDSPHFGERWARHWMDLVRYAETYGHEFDYVLPHAAAYRDYLIRALNADVPYNQLVREHLAGDLIAEPRRHPQLGTNESILGTGFWWLGEATHAPVDLRGDTAGRMDNQLDVMGKAFLGLTLGCARCHDHKFDAISAADYYALVGYLKSSRRQESFLDPGGQIASSVERLSQLQREGDKTLRQALAMHRPSGQQFAAFLLAAQEVLDGAEPDPAKRQTRVAEVAAKRQLDPQRLAAWTDLLTQPAVAQPSHPLYAWNQLARDPSPAALAQLRKRVADETAAAAARAEQYPVLSEFQQPDAWFRDGAAFAGDALQPLWDARQTSPQLAIPGTAHSGRWSDRMQGVLRSPTFTLEHDQILWKIRGRGVKLRLILETYFMDVYNGLLFGGFAIDLNQDAALGWVTQGGDIRRYKGNRGYLEISDSGDGYAQIEEIRFGNGGTPPELIGPITRNLLDTQSLGTREDLAAAFGPLWEAAVQACTTGQADAAQTELVNLALQTGLCTLPADVTKALAELRTQVQQTSDTMPAPPRILTMGDGTPEESPLFIRGNHRTPGDIVPRRFLTALTNGEPESLQGSGRLQLAEQIVDPDNPLTARVYVNRLWHHLFGRGIVPSTDNFGVLGQPPTHPELLDHLAQQLIDEGWSTKRMLRQIMLSQTYQMSSQLRPEAAAIDPDNQLLHRQRVRRLQGEAIRDAVLFISGRFDPTVYGPSIPIHVTPFMQGRGRPGQSGPLDGAGRRSIYIEVRRNFLSPMMLAFDTPIPFNAVGQRNVSNVPAQALIMMNDPLVIEQANLWAKHVLQNQPATDQRIERLYWDAFSRPPTDVEKNQAREFLAQQSAEYGLPAQADPQDERVWSDLCHVLFNVKEFLFLQ